MNLVSRTRGANARIPLCDQTAHHSRKARERMGYPLLWIVPNEGWATLQRGETRPAGGLVHSELVFANPQTAKSRDASGIAPTVGPGNVAKVYDFFSGRRVG
jgi:hypothetical protein